MVIYQRRERFDYFSTRVGIIFSQLRLSPNVWTILSLFPAIVGAYFIVQQDFYIAVAFFAVAAFLDVIDGSVARVMGKVTKFGAFLDTIVDRYVEGILLLSFLLLPLPAFFVPHYVLIFLVLFGDMLTTYAKAAAKEKELIVGMELRGGIMERPERMVLFFIGILAASVNLLYLTYILVLLAVLTNLTALQRIWSAAKLVKQTI